MKVKLLTIKEIERNKTLAETYLTYRKNKVYSIHGIDTATYKKLSKKEIDVRRDPYNEVYYVNDDYFMPFCIPYVLVKELEGKTNE